MTRKSRKGMSKPIVTLQSEPLMIEYEDLKKRLAANTRALCMLRLLAETGMTRIELATLEKRNWNETRRDMYISRAKAVRNKVNGEYVYIERKRHVPINASLLSILKPYLESHDSPFVIAQAHHYKKIHHMDPSSINELFLKWDIDWSPHKFRHFFKSQVYWWMVKERRVDEGILEELMGHNLTQNREYGTTAWEYKLEIVDEVFG